MIFSDRLVKNSPLSVDYSLVYGSDPVHTVQEKGKFEQYTDIDPFEESRSASKFVRRLFIWAGDLVDSKLYIRLENKGQVKIDSVVYVVNSVVDHFYYLELNLRLHNA